MTGGMLGPRNMRRVLRGYCAVGVAAAAVLWTLAAVEALTEPPIPQDPTIEIVRTAPAGSDLDVSRFPSSGMILWVEPADADVAEVTCTTARPSGTQELVAASPPPPGWEVAEGAEDGAARAWARVTSQVETGRTIACSGGGISSVGVSEDSVTDAYETDERIPSYLGRGAAFLLSGLGAGAVARRFQVGAPRSRRPEGGGVRTADRS